MKEIQASPKCGYCGVKMEYSPQYESIFRCPRCQYSLTLSSGNLACCPRCLHDIIIARNARGVMDAYISLCSNPTCPSVKVSKSYGFTDRYRIFHNLKSVLHFIRGAFFFSVDGIRVPVKASYLQFRAEYLIQFHEFAIRDIITLPDHVDDLKGVLPC